MERVLCWSWTNSAYVYIAWIWHVLLVIDAVWGRNLTFTRCSNTLCTIITALRWSSFVGWMYGTGVVLALDDQHVRLYCCVCVLELGAVAGDRHNMHEVVISPSHTLQWRWWLYIDLRPSNVWNRCRVGSGGTVCTFRSYIACIWHMLLIGDRCSMRS